MDDIEEYTIGLLPGAIMHTLEVLRSGEGRIGAFEGSILIRMLDRLKIEMQASITKSEHAEQSKTER